MLATCLELLRSFYKIDTYATPVFDFAIPNGLAQFYKSFPDTTVLDGQDYLNSHPCPLAREWYGIELPANLVQVAFENQVVWFIATTMAQTDDSPAFLINDYGVTEYPSFNLYFACFLLNQTVRNSKTALVSEMPSNSAIWDQHAYHEFGEGWEHPSAFGYDSFRVSANGGVIAGFHSDGFTSIVSNGALPHWLNAG